MCYNIILITVINIVEEGRYGGPQRRIVEVAQKALEKDILTVIVFPVENSTRLQKEVTKLGLAHEKIELTRLSKSFVGIWRYAIKFIPEIARLKRLLLRYDGCIVHCNGSYQIKGIIAAKLLKYQCVWHLNDTYAPIFVHWLFNIVRMWAKPNFLVASNRTKNYYLGNKISRSIRVLNEPVNCDYFKPLNRSPISSEKVLRVLVVANVSPVKGLEVFIDMALYINSFSKLEFEFVIAGKILDSHQKYYNELLDRIGSTKNITFLGEALDVKHEYQNADIYVCSSKFESSPMAVWEAMSMELPIVSTDVGDVRQVFETHKCGLVSNDNNPKDIAQLVLFIADNPNKALGMSKRAREVAIQLFDISSCVQGHKEFYLEVMSNTK